MFSIRHITILSLFVMAVQRPMEAQVVPTALTVARTTPLTEASDPIVYPEVVVDLDNQWDRVNNHVDILRSSSYWFHINVATMPFQKVDVDLWGNVNADFFRTSTSHNGIDTSGRDIIVHQEAGTIAYSENNMDSSLYADAGRQTSLTVIELESYLSDIDPKIFCATRSQFLDEPGKVHFTENPVNVGQGWDVIDQTRFNITKSGVYLFALSVGLRSGKPMQARIESKDIGILAELTRTSTIHNGSDHVSKIIMAYLEAEDSVSVNLLNGEIYSDGQRQTTFSGFLYNPVSGLKKAWSVFSINNASAVGEDIQKLPFDGYTVNTELLFDFNENIVNIDTAGLYFLHLSVSAVPGQNVSANIVRNPDRTEINILKTTTNHNGIDPMSHGMLMELSVGNTLRVELLSGSHIYSDGDRHTTFTGLLVYPY